MNGQGVMHSGIYKGWLSHVRVAPKRHGFCYPVFMMYLDLDELEHVLSLTKSWSTSQFSPARFSREDFLAPYNVELKCAVKDCVENALGFRPDGAVRVLANLRYFGFIINPMTCYYCFDSNNDLVAIVTEVTNTPWQEKHAYVLRCDPNVELQRISFDKAMHVSPFNPMDMEYRWVNDKPTDRLSINLQNWMQDDVGKDGMIFCADLKLNREEITADSLRRIIASYPWMTLKVACLIYWNALKLWLKNVPLHRHPNKAGT